jgi:hypothetical protein
MDAAFASRLMLAVILATVMVRTILRNVHPVVSLYAALVIVLYILTGGN